jgi:hypothetical protein
MSKMTFRAFFSRTHDIDTPFKEIAKVLACIIPTISLDKSFQRREEFLRSGSDQGSKVVGISA